MKTLLMFCLATLIVMPSFADKAKSLKEVLDIVYKKNPRLSESQQNLNVEESLITSQATLDDPMIGFSNLDRNMQTQYATISQKIKFPVKYFLQAKMQSRRRDMFKSQLEIQRLKLREQTISLYYNIYSTQKIIQLTRANMEAVKEFARVAEKKYAAGKSPQGDSMKAHFELTQLELELLTLHQQEEALQENLKALVNDMEFESLELSHLLLSTPKFNNNHITDSLPQLQAFLQNQSPNIKFQAQALKEAEYKSSLAKWAYAPDFQLQYQQSISGEPSDSNIYSIAMSIPLWFWKEKAEASAANSKMLAQEYRLKDTLQKSIAKVKELKGKVETGLKTLNIYETSLIPQAQSAYNSTRSSYTANKTSFLDLLDSERSLYRVRIGFYQALKQYVNQLSQLESELGFSVSNLEIKNKETK